MSRVDFCGINRKSHLSSESVPPHEEADMGVRGKMIKLAEISGVWYSTGEVYSPLDVKLTKDDILQLEEMRKCR